MLGQPPRILATLVLAIGCIGPAIDRGYAADVEQPVQLTSDCAAHFAAIEVGEILTTDDAFTASLSRFDLQCRLKTSADVTLADWKRFARDNVRRWEAAEIDSVRQAQRLAEQFSPYRLPLPPDIQLIRTTGDEEACAAYTRSAAIILPNRVMRMPSSSIACSHTNCSISSADTTAEFAPSFTRSLVLSFASPSPCHRRLRHGGSPIPSAAGGLHDRNRSRWRQGVPCGAGALLLDERVRCQTRWQPVSIPGFPPDAGRKSAAAGTNLS